MFLGVLLHFVLGVMFAGTGWLVRSACIHEGVLPHRWQLPLTLALILVEAYFSVLLVG